MLGKHTTDQSFLVRGSQDGAKAIGTPREATARAVGVETTHFCLSAVTSSWSIYRHMYYLFGRLRHLELESQLQVAQVLCKVHLHMYTLIWQGTP